VLYVFVVWWLFGWSVDLIWKVYISVVRQLGDGSANLTLEEEGIFFGGLPARLLVGQPGNGEGIYFSGFAAR